MCVCCVDAQDLVEVAQQVQHLKCGRLVGHLQLLSDPPSSTRPLQQQPAIEQAVSKLSLLQEVMPPSMQQQEQLLPVEPRQQLQSKKQQQQQEEEQQQQQVNSGQQIPAGDTQQQQQKEQLKLALDQQKDGEEDEGPALSYVLLVVDGTWRQAREMFDDMQPWLMRPQGPGRQVQLPGQQQQQQHHPDLTLAETPPTLLQRDSHSRLRTEPAEGTCSTLEAVAAAVAVLEGDTLLFETLMRPLRLLTHHQAQYDPAVAARLQPGGSGVVAHKKRLGMRNRLERH